MFKYKSMSKTDVEQKINKLHNPGQKRNILKITETAQVVRIIPYIHNDTGCPFIEKRLHYELKGGTVACPTSFGEECPVCEFGSELWKKGQKDMAKKFFKKQRIYVPVISRDDASHEVKFMSISDSIYQDILNTIADPDYGDVVHPFEGRDLTVVKIAEGQYGKITIKFKPKTSPIAEDEKTMERILNSCPNFDSIYPVKTYEELEDVLKKTMDSNEKTAETSEKVSTDKDYQSEIEKALGN